MGSGRSGHNPLGPYIVKGNFQQRIAPHLPHRGNQSLAESSVLDGIPLAEVDRRRYIGLHQVGMLRPAGDRFRLCRGWPVVAAPALNAVLGNFLQKPKKAEEY